MAISYRVGSQEIIPQEMKFVQLQQRVANAVQQQVISGAEQRGRPSADLCTAGTRWWDWPGGKAPRCLRLSLVGKPRGHRAPSKCQEAWTGGSSVATCRAAHQKAIAAG